MGGVRWFLLVALVSSSTASMTSFAFAQSETGAEDAPSEAADTDAFWADRRQLRVLQRRLFQKRGRAQLSLMVSAIPNDPFHNYFPIGLRVGYHITEQISIDIGGHYIGETFQTDTDLERCLEGGCDGAQDGITLDVLDEQLLRANFTLYWSPLYGKFSMLGRKIGHVDWYLGAGMGVVQVQSIQDTGVGYEKTIKPEGILTTGMTWWLHQNWALRIDYRQGIFEKVGGGVNWASEMGLGGRLFL